MGLFDYPVHSEAASTAGSTPSAFTFLEGLSPESWKKILAHAEIIHLNVGDVIIEDGAQDDSFYILSAGEVEAVVVKGRKEVVVARIPQGSVFGEIAFFAGAPRSATIRAKTSGTAVRITRENFDRLTSWEPALARAILFDLGKILALRLRWTTQLIGR